MPRKRASEPDSITIGRLANLIKESSSNGQRFCFILGSGASVSSGIPSGKTLEMRWMNCLMGESNDGTTEKMNPIDTEKTAEKLYREKKIDTSFSEIKAAWEEARKPGGRSISSRYYFDIYKLRFYPERRNGYKYLAQQMANREPSVGYHPLARLLADKNGIDLVITTNFDSLTEDALFIYTDERPLVISHESLVDYIDLDNRQRPIVAKVHRGLFYEPKNDRESTGKLSEGWKNALNLIFSQYTPIVIGYAGGDKSLMSYLENKSTSIKGGIYWCYLKNDPPEERIYKLVSSKRGCLVEINGFDDAMLTIGQIFYGDSLIPTETGNRLQDRAKRRKERYDGQWTKWAVEDKTEHDEAITKLIEAETREENKRADNNQLTAQDHFRRGFRANLDKRFNDSIEEYTEAIRLDKNSISSYNNRGGVYISLEKYDEALADLSEAIRLFPYDGGFYYNRGKVLFLQQKYEDSIRDLNLSIQLMPDYSDSIYYRGLAYYNLKQYHKAIMDLNEALRLNPNSIDSYYYRALSYFQTNRFDEAIFNLTEALRFNPRNAFMLMNRAYIYDAYQKYSQAIADYSEAIRLQPDSADAYSNRSFTYYKAKEYEKSIADADKALTIDPQCAYAFCNRGISLNKLGEHEKALEDLSMCLELLSEEDKENQVLGRRYRAEIYRALGMEEEALSDERNAAEIEQSIQSS